MSRPGCPQGPRRAFVFGAAGVVLALAGGCGGLLPKPSPLPSFYSLGAAPPGARDAVTVPAGPPEAAPTLTVGLPRAAPGFDSQRIIYQREANRLEYFAHHEWVDTPARMLVPLIVTAVESRGAFHAVVSAPSAAAGQLRLETEIVRLQQDFTVNPSQVRFTLRAHLVDSASRRVLAWRAFDASVPALSDDPPAGVVAADRAVRVVLEQLARFCADAVAKRP